MRRWYPAIPLAGVFLFSAIVYSRLPEPMVMHWGLNGRPNGYSNRAVGAFLLPVIALCLVVTLLVVLRIFVLGFALGSPMPDPIRMTCVLVGVMTLILGNVLPRARSTWWVGIRTPWTLSIVYSDIAWREEQQ